MAQPRDYTRQYNFNDYQTTNPSDPLPGTQVDNELNAVKLTLDDLNENIGLIQRDDGKLSNLSVHKDAFAVDALALIGTKGYTPKGDWTGGTAYDAGDLVNFNDATYLSTVAHTAGNVFNTDQAAGKWILLANAAINTSASSYDQYEGDGTTTSFTLTFQYSSDEDVLVFINGSLRTPTDDYQISGSTITFTTAPSAPSVAGTENVIVIGTSIIVEAAKATAQAAASDAEGYRDDAQDWASKVDGVVPTTTEYSAKAHAIGGTGVDTGDGSAKDWAQKIGSAVGNTTEYSAKEQAIGNTSPDGSAKEWALGHGSTFDENTPITGTGNTAQYAARYYATQAEEYASHFKSGGSDPYAAAGITKQAGDVWYNTTSNDLYIWSGSAFELMVSYSDAVIHDNLYEPTAGTTVLSGNDTNNSALTLVNGAKILVYINGNLVQDSDFTVDYSTSELTLVDATVANDEVRILQVHPFTSVDYNTLVDARADAVKLATHPEDSQYTLSGNTTGYSALHYNAKAQDRKEDAEKLAINPVDTQYTLEDGTTTGYSALHHATKAGEHNLDAEKLATNAEDSQFTLTDGTTGFSALHYQAKAQDNKDDAQKLAIEPEDSQFTLADGTTTGYSALHYAEKASEQATNAQASANSANSPWTQETGTTNALYNNGEVKVTGSNNLSVSDGSLQIKSTSDAVIGEIKKSDHSQGGLLIAGNTQNSTATSVGTIGLYRESGNAFISFHNGSNSGARAGYIQSVEPQTDAIGNGFYINPEGTGQGDYTTFGGKGIRSRGNWQFLGESTNTTDVANYAIQWTNFGFDQNDFDLLCIKFINPGTTSSASIQCRFYFNGTRFDGANYRWVENRAYVDSTTAYNTAGRGWDSSYFRIAATHDSTSHWSHVELYIPNPGKQAYHDYGTTAYQGYWAKSFGNDGSSRPRAALWTGFVNSTTSRTDVTGVFVDATAGNMRNQVFEIYGLPRGGAGAIE